MSVPFLSPGQTDPGVPRLKKLLVPELLKLGLTPFAQKISVESTTYGPTAKPGVREFQKAKKLEVDGCVGKNTWAALGVNEPVVGGPKPAKAEQVAGGQVIIAPGANLPGQSIEAMTLEFVAAMAKSIGKPITVTTGTTTARCRRAARSPTTSPGTPATSGCSRTAARMTAPSATRSCRQPAFCGRLEKEGASAKAKGGGLFNLQPQQPADPVHLEDQQGSDHHNHVHVGVRPA